MSPRSARIALVLAPLLAVAVACGGARDASSDPTADDLASSIGTTQADTTVVTVVVDPTTSGDPSGDPATSTDTPTTPAPTDPGASSTSDATPATSQSDIGDLTVTPRLIPVDGDLAEVIFALGEGGDVVATDLSATYPPEADALPQIGYQRSLTAEPIAAFEPTMVLATDIAGPPQVLDDLERLGIQVELIPTESAPSGPGDKIRAVADVLGVSSRGEELAAQVDAEIAAATARAAATTERPRVAVLYIRGEDVQLLFGEDSDIDWVVDAAGAVNIADGLGVLENAPINIESFVEAAPEVLIVTEDGLASVGGIDGLLALPGIAETPAGAAGRILDYDAQYLLGNGPRTGQLLDELITDLHGDLP